MRVGACGSSRGPTAGSRFGIVVLWLIGILSACGGAQETDERWGPEPETRLEARWERVANAEDAEQWRLELSTVRLRRGREADVVARLDALERRVERDTCAVDALRRSLGAGALPSGWLSPAAAQRCLAAPLDATAIPSSLDGQAPLAVVSRLLERTLVAGERDFLDGAWLERWAPSCAEGEGAASPACRDAAYAAWLVFLDTVTEAQRRASVLERAYVADLLEEALAAAQGACLQAVEPTPWTTDTVRLRLPWSVFPQGGDLHPVAWPAHTLVVRSDALFLAPSPRQCWCTESDRFRVEAAPLQDPMARLERPGALAVSDLDDGRVPALRAAWRASLRSDADEAQRQIVSTVALVADAETMVSTLEALLLTLHDDGVQRVLWWVSDRQGGGRFLALRLVTDPGEVAVRVSIRHDGYVIRAAQSADESAGLSVVLRSAGTRLESISQAVWAALSDPAGRLVLVLDDPAIDIGLLAPLLDALTQPRVPADVQDIAWLGGAAESDRAPRDPAETSVWLLLQAR